MHFYFTSPISPYLKIQNHFWLIAHLIIVFNYKNTAILITIAQKRIRIAPLQDSFVKPGMRIRIKTHNSDFKYLN